MHHCLRGPRASSTLISTTPSRLSPPPLLCLRVLPLRISSTSCGGGGCGDSTSAPMEGPSASAPTPMVGDSNATSMGKKVQPLPLLLPRLNFARPEAIDARSLGSLLGSEAALAAVAVRTGETLIPEPTLSQLVPLAPTNCAGFCSYVQVHPVINAHRLPPLSSSVDLVSSQTEIHHALFVPPYDTLTQDANFPL
ncbi:hypothetical protein BDZ97DRAFT_1921272 [Flammula alnicola]|nr:hypothetical protein BDZ97DRAFT_1921272 [Flammula alnicola]